MKILIIKDFVLGSLPEPISFQPPLATARGSWSGLLSKEFSVIKGAGCYGESTMSKFLNQAHKLMNLCSCIHQTGRV